MSDDAPERTDKEKYIAETWGEGFVRFADHPRMEFGETHITVTLWKPIKINGVEAPKVAIGEPTMDQMVQLDRAPGEMAKTRRLLMQAGGLTEKEAGAIGLRDVTLLGLLVAAFTDSARATGA